MQVDIESSYTDTKEIFFEQDNGMGDRDDRNIGLGRGRNGGLDQEDVMLRWLLGTLEEGKHMQ